MLARFLIISVVAASDRRLGMRIIIPILLAGVLIGFAILRPKYTNGVSADDLRNACIANLKQIQSAKTTWMLDRRKTTNDVPTDRDLFGPTRYIKCKPTCLGGGEYSIGHVGENPKCSVNAHALAVGSIN